MCSTAQNCATCVSSGINCVWCSQRVSCSHGSGGGGGGGGSMPACMVSLFLIECNIACTCMCVFI